MNSDYQHPLSRALDFVPVLGTAKNTLECCTAIFIEGDLRKAAQKGASAVIGGALDVATIGGASAVSAMFTYGAQEGMRIVAKKGVQVTGGWMAANVAGRVVQNNPHVPYNVVANIRHAFNHLWEKDPNDQRNNRNIKERPSKRGEHVINHGVLRVYRDIVHSFVRDEMGDDLNDLIKNGWLSRDSTIVKLINKPIPEHVAEFISSRMVVHFDRPFEDTNAIHYGNEIKKLRNDVIAYMKTLYNGYLTKDFSHLPGIERNVRDSVESFIAGDYFVDVQALQKWVKQRGNMHAQEKFKIVHEYVVSMFRNLRYGHGYFNDGIVITWVKELMEARRKKSIYRK